MSTSSARIPDEYAANLVDPAAYADGRIHDTYAWLRANNPFGLAEIEGFDPFWVATKHADILEISRQNALFHNGDKATVITNKAADTAVRAMMALSPGYRASGRFARDFIALGAPELLEFPFNRTSGWRRLLDARGLARALLPARAYQALADLDPPGFRAVRKYVVAPDGGVRGYG